jgi:hypothetical protein
MVSDKAWESNEISMWVNNDESLHELARQSESSNDFFDMLEMIGVPDWWYQDNPAECKGKLGGCK